LVAGALQGLISIVSTAAEMTEQGDFSRRLAEESRDPESAELARTFNRLVGRVDHLLAVQRQLVADTSHELRTPITTISGNLELLAGPLPESERADVLGETRQEVARLRRLVDDLLLLAEIGESVNPERQPLRLDHLARDAVTRLSAAEGRRVQLVAERVVVLGDEERLGQVVSNLLQNALRYASTAPGAVRVRVDRTECDACIIVQDDGPGIPPHAVEQVFDRFSRLDRARSRAHGGSGLGLAIVRHVAEAHGGRTWAENRVEGGARFCVQLPALASDGLLDRPMGREHGCDPRMSLCSRKRRRGSVAARLCVGGAGGGRRSTEPRRHNHKRAGAKAS
jgi:signal transduction histidine kinase